LENRLIDNKIEEFSRSELLSYQWNLLQNLLKRVYSQDCLFGSSLKRAGVSLDQIRTMADFQRLVPTSDKATLLADQTAQPPYGTRLIAPREEVAFSFLTSGTSGKGQEVHAYSFQDYDELLDSWGLNLKWSGVSPGDTAYVMMPIGTTVGPVSLMMAFHKYGLQTFNVGHLEGAERLQMMKRFQPNFFTTSPLYLRRLTNICLQHDIDPKRDFPHLKVIKLGTFSYDVAWAREMEAFWGARLSDIYASTQGGAGIATTCEHGVYRPDGSRAMMHFMEHRAIFEVVNPGTGENAKDGEEGEVIITTLRTAMPLIRFRTGDKVIFREHKFCACGRPFAGIEVGTVSRYDSMLKVRGMNLWPEAVDAIVFKHSEIEEYNGRVTVDPSGREAVELLVAFRSTADLNSQRCQKILSDIELEAKTLTNVAMRAIAAENGNVEKFIYKGSRWKDMRAAVGA
jgi:phenylacetate-CoA ligase